MIYVLYGQPGSGKTSIGKVLAEWKNTSFIIDGDEFRDMFANKNYGKEGREENIRNANAVATYLNKRGGHDVILCLVNPYEYLRKELKNNNKNKVIEIYLHSSRDLRKEYHVKDFEAGSPDVSINTDLSVEISSSGCVRAIGRHLS
jgi:adenylylsulfate kinase-like enzyme